MDFFLEKESTQKLNVLSYLDICNHKTANIATIMNKLNMSEFLVIKAIKGIMADIEEYHISELSLNLNDKKVTMTHGESAVIQVLSWQYLQKSIHFQLFDAIFKHSVTSLEIFAQDHFISLSKAYILKTQLEDYLKKYQIKISSDFSFLGEESRIRMMLFNFYFSRFNGIQFPFNSGIEKMATKFTQAICQNLSTQISETQKLKLKFFAAVTFQRLHNHVNIVLTKDKKFTIVDSLTITTRARDFFKQHTTMDDALISDEIQFLEAFLLAENFIDAAVSFEEETLLLQIQTLTTNFLNTIESYFNKPLPAGTKTMLEKELNRIHGVFLYIKPIDAYFKTDNQFIEESYPDFYRFTTYFTSSLYDELEDFEVHHETYLFYEYIFSLIKWTPSSYVTNPIYICIDFSYGNTYNHFISQNIKSFHFLNIHIEYHLSEKTDLYLSDLHIPNIECPSIIWNAPPTASDWENFGNKIVQIKNGKYGGDSHA